MSNRPNFKRALSAAESQKLNEAILGELTERPPVLGAIGLSGVGKTSTANRLFKTSLAVGHTAPCTKEFRAVQVNVTATNPTIAGATVPLIFKDAPGLGEDRRRDVEYLKMYQEHLPSCDVILWVIAARNRALALDELYLEQLRPFVDRMVFAVGQVDLVAPMDWVSGLPMPTGEQARNIEAVVEDRSNRLSAMVGRRVEVVPYSNERGYNLEGLFGALLDKCRDRRGWVFELLKNCNVEETVDPDLLRRVEEYTGRHAEQKHPAFPGRWGSRSTRSAGRRTF